MPEADSGVVGRMGEKEYFNMLFHRLEEAFHAHNSAHTLRLRTTGSQGPSVTPEVAAQRAAIGELAARILEGIRDEAIDLAFYEYKMYLKEHRPEKLKGVE